MQQGNQPARHLTPNDFRRMSIAGNPARYTCNACLDGKHDLCSTNAPDLRGPCACVICSPLRRLSPACARSSHTACDGTTPSGHGCQCLCHVSLDDLGRAQAAHSDVYLYPTDEQPEDADQQARDRDALQRAQRAIDAGDTDASWSAEGFESVHFCEDCGQPCDGDSRFCADCGRERDYLHGIESENADIYARNAEAARDRADRLAGVGEYEDEDDADEDDTDESLGDWQARLAAEQVTFYYNELDKIASKARTGQQYWELGGIDGISPLAALSQALQRQLDETNALAAHAHVWDTETGYCSICGLDGRA